MRMTSHNNLIRYIPMLLVFLIGCHSAQEKRELADRAREKAEAEKVRKFFDDRYHPLANWQNQLQSESFSIEAERTFVRDDHRPILFYATLNDIKSEDGLVNLYLTTTPTESEPVLRLVLTCQSCDLNYIRKQPKDIGDFAVVVEPAKVGKALDLPEGAPDYVLYGKVVDARWVGDYAFNIAIQNATPK